VSEGESLADANASAYEAQFQPAVTGVLDELGLRESSDSRLRPTSGHHSSILVPCDGVDGRPFILKYFIPPEEGRFYPAGVRIEDYARRESAFYRYLDSVDSERHHIAAPRTVLLDPLDPPHWILLERIAGAVGPVEEVLGMDHVFEVLRALHDIPIEGLAGRRDFPLNRWDPLSYLERVRMMYDPVLYVIGEERWTRTMEFYQEALRWTETRPQRVVHGDFTADNILVDEDGAPYLIDFERVGTGSEDHDFAWFWIHAERSQEWKRGLLQRYWHDRVGSERVRSEWGIRGAVVYLALRRLRFSYLIHGGNDPDRAQNLGLLDAALMGRAEFFPA